MSAATEQAFKGLIPIGKFGFVILNITMNPSKVDVNVHPSKVEVRFEEENKIFQSIYHAIKDTLLKNELVASTEKKEETENLSKGLFDFRKNETKKIEQYNEEESKIKTNAINVGQGGPINTADVLEQLKKLKQDLQNQIEEKVPVKLNSDFIETKDNEEQDEKEKIEEVIKDDLIEESVQEENTEEKNQEVNNQDEIKESKQDITEKKEISENIEEIKKQETKLEEIKEQIKELESLQYEEKVPENFSEMYEKLFGTTPISTKKEETINEIPEETAVDLIKDNMSIFEENEEYKKPIYKFIGIVFNTYIIIEIDKEMYIIDQHAAHERIMYEKVKKNYYSDTSKDSQMLLLPDIITLTHKEMNIARDNIDMFEKAGFTLEEFGENTIKLTGVPTVCIDLDNKELFLETLDEINTVARTAKQEKEEKFIATVACKAAVKANMVLNIEEVENLMDKLLELPNPFTCPHGRPTAIKMSKYDIERKFARK
ncbi:MAG: hypothetical protein IJE05_05515 [Clostridia bacterium]|nr:hypothetical protein [Clostridia bacterium]